MPRDGRGIWSPPPGTRAVPNAIIESEKYNAFVEDVQADLNASRPLTAGGTSATNAADARANLGAASVDDLKATNADLIASKDRFAGDIKSAQTELGRKFDKAGGTVTGAIISSAETPIAFKNRTSADHWHISSTGGRFSLFWDARGGNGAAGDKFTVDSASGAIWCAQFGDLNTRIETRAREYAEERANAKLDRTGGTMTGDIEIKKGDAAIMLHFPGVRWWKMIASGDARLNFQNSDGAVSFGIGPGGEIHTRQFGDLNTRIETRAREYAEDRAGRVVARWAFAGDVPYNRNHQVTPVEHYNGAAITGHAAAGGRDLQLRYRYLQMKNAQDQWYTVPFI